MRKLIFASLLAGLTGSVSSFAAEPSEFLLYSLDDRTVALELVNNGGASALQVEIAMPLGASAEGSSGRCVVSLPSSHQGVCTARGGVVKLVVFSPRNAILPSGRIGTLDVSEAVVGGKKGPKVQKLLLGDAEAKQVPVTALIDVGSTLLEQHFD